MVDQRLAAHLAAGMFSGVACELGNNEFPEFVNCVEREARREDTDGLYVFADFEWSFTPDGLRRVGDAFESSGLRLYVETIGSDPPELRELAERSGGAIIRTPK